MRKLIFVLIFVAFGFLMGYFYRPFKAALLSIFNPESSKTVVTYPILKDQSFVIFIFGGADSNDYKQTLFSVLSQEYDDFKVFYIDYGQQEGREEEVRTFLSFHDPFQRVRYVSIESEQDAFQSLYQILHGRPCSDIALMLNANDSLSSKSVLSRLNSVYANSDVWMTFGRCADYPSYREIEKDKKCVLKELNRKEDRKSASFLFSTFHSFYVGLFKRIKLQDFLHEGRFFSSLESLIYMAPILELARHHAVELDEIMSLKKTRGTSESKWKQAGEHLNHFSSYPPLLIPPDQNFLKNKDLVDLIVFSDNSPLELFAFLESTEKSICHLHHLFVIYFSKNEHYEKEYKRVKEAFPKVTFFKQHGLDHDDFSLLVKKVLFDREIAQAPYVALALDHVIIKEKIDLQSAAGLLKKTGAYAFFMHLGKDQEQLENTPETISIDEGVSAWQFNALNTGSCLSHLIDFTLYKREDIYFSFQGMNFNHINALKTLWENQIESDKLGLFYSRAKSMELPFTFLKQSEEKKQKCAFKAKNHLLQLFHHGLKIDIETLKSLQTEPITTEDMPKMIERQ